MTMVFGKCVYPSMVLPKPIEPNVKSEERFVFVNGKISVVRHVEELKESPAGLFHIRHNGVKIDKIVLFTTDGSKKVIMYTDHCGITYTLQQVEDTEIFYQTCHCPTSKIWRYQWDVPESGFNMLTGGGFCTETRAIAMTFDATS